MNRTFAPEMSHFNEVSVPLALGKGCGIPSSQRSQEVQASELVEASLLVEVWHQVPRKDDSSDAEASSAVVGRRLGPSFQDVLLGVAYVPLKRLLRHTGMCVGVAWVWCMSVYSTGVHGWYPLLPPATPHVSPVLGPTHLEPWQNPPVVRCAYVGGVEVSAAFSTKRDRQLVLSSLESACGPSKLLDVGGEGEEGPRHWEVDLQVQSLWVEDQTVFESSRQPVHCFLRYRFFDLGGYCIVLHYWNSWL
jgi:hypothetical protein